MQSPDGAESSKKFPSNTLTFFRWTRRKWKRVGISLSPGCELSLRSIKIQISFVLSWPYKRWPLQDTITNANAITAPLLFQISVHRSNVSAFIAELDLRHISNYYIPRDLRQRSLYYLSQTFSQDLFYRHLFVLPYLPQRSAKTLFV